MLETALANLRFGASMMLGLPFHRRSLDRLVEAMRQTHHQMGGLGDDTEELLGPTFDAGTRQVVQARRFRSQALRAARETSYYPPVFEQAGIDPKQLTWDDIPRVPVTTKEALRADPEAFVRSGARLGHRVTTTGTTGRPTSVWFTDDELHLIGVLSTITLFQQRIILPEDVVQISINTRALLGVTGIAFASAAIGAALHTAGMVSPEHTLALLSERHRIPGKKPRVSVMSTYPSYLGRLVETARRLGYRPVDFGLERIVVGGEILSDGLQRRAREVLGDVSLVESYNMTEFVPFGANACSQGHLHFEPSVGLAEVLDLELRRPARPGEPGVLVATPLPPFRDATVLLRYNTEDVLRPVEEGELTCELRRLPATSRVLGKLRLAVRHDHGWTFARDVVEALEAVHAVPLPARYGFRAVPDGVAVEVLAPAAARAAIEEQLAARGVPLAALRLTDDRERLNDPFPLRCDLQEGSWAQPAGHPGRATELAATVGG